jgi:type VI secretion system protein VasJ
MDLLDLGKSPISKENPAGEDVRSFPEYERLQEEIDKLSSPTASAGVDWKKVGDLSRDILATKSKHLHSAIYLCHSLLIQRGFEGLADGTGVLKDLLENYWETLYPETKRMRARKNVFEWWVNVTASTISNLQDAAWTKQDIKAAIGNLEAIEKFIQEHIEDAPTLNPLIQKVSTLTPSEASPSAERATQKSPVQAAPSRATTAQSPRGDAVTSDDPIKLLNAGLELLSQASNIRIKQEILTPHPFLINRIVAWLPVETLPPADNGNTKIPPPDPQLFATLDTLYRESRWRDLISACESKVRQYLFWLDLSHYSYMALEGMGRSEISAIVANETSNFVKRLSGIETLRFSNGTPFAGEATIEWIRQLGKVQVYEETVQETSANLDDEMSKFFKQAKKDIKENKLTLVLKEFQIKRGQTASPRTRLFWDMGFCTLFINTKYARLVVSYLNEILNTLTQYRIEEWEPALAVEALTLVVTGFKKQKTATDTGVDYRLMCEEAINRLSLLNPMKAVEHV